MTALTPEVAAIKSTLDELVLAAPDPAAVMASVVKVWALGGAAADDLLDDLEALAISAALHRGLELTAPELLEAYGHIERADRIRCAVEQGRAAFWQATTRVARLHDIVIARGAA